VPEVTKEGLKECHGWVFAPHDSASYPKNQFKKLNPSGTMRQYFDLYSNVRPAKTYPGVKNLVGDVDVVIFRENREGFMPDRNMYGGYGEFMPTPDVVVTSGIFTRKGCTRIAHEAFKMAMTRKKHVTCVHKANVIKMAYGMFRDIVYQVGQEHYPEVRIDDFHIDAMTSHLVKRMSDFDVIVTTNLFGDILSDLACELSGSLGLGPSINTNENQCMAQAAHGSAPDIAGQNIANPVGLMLSAVMMFEWLSIRHGDSRMGEAAKKMQEAVLSAMNDRILTPDMGGTASTSDFTEAVLKKIEK
jgi:3-isopropylmalate dehydrogenase